MENLKSILEQTKYIEEMLIRNLEHSIINTYRLEQMNYLLAEMVGEK